MKLQPRRGLLRFVPLSGRVKLTRVIEGSDLNGQYSLARLRWFFTSQIVALRVYPGVPNGQALNTILLLRALGERTHANVQEVFGTCKSGNQWFIVSSYCEGGKLLPHLRSMPTLDRRKFVLQLASGLHFLHANGIVHAELCARNILVSGSGQAVLSGFPQPLHVETSHLESLDWHATEDKPEPPPAEDSDAPHEFLVDPEIDWTLKPRPVVMDKPLDASLRLQVAADLKAIDSAGDIFAFGFLMMEIFSELSPADCQSALRVLRMVRKGQRPPHAGRVAELRGLDALHWQVCLHCWVREPADRITSQGLVERLQEARNVVRPAFEWPTDALEAFVASRVPNLRTRVVDIHDVREGRDAERGLYEVEGIMLQDDQTQVRVKLVTPFIARRMTFRRRRDYLTEAFVWSQLQHPNILPLLGTAYYEQTDNCSVVPWTVGSCLDYLRVNPNANRLNMLAEIADALHYLHSRAPTILHGYVRARHVLVSADGNAFLASFDFQPFWDPEEPWDVSWGSDAQDIRWLPPEISITPRTTKSDIFGFGMLAYELYSGQLPMHHVTDGVNRHTLDCAWNALQRGERPERPEDKNLTDEIWSIVQSCWQQSPFLRPSMRTVAAQLGELLRTG